ncbi:MAG: LPS-assembly protein LptD [Candidatus Pelagibacter sp.]
MKNSFFFIVFLVIFCRPLSADNLNIQSSTISIDKDSKLTVFKNNVVATDNENNVLKTEYAEFDKDLKKLISKGDTTIITSEGYILKGKNILFDNKNKIIESKDPAIITDFEKNNIFLENFKYFTKESFFKSVGNIKIIDFKNNSYNFSQVYIDEKKKEIIGTDIKAFLNDKNFRVKDKNKPRVFANTVKIDDKGNEFTKSIFTLCDYRKNDKCPPWSIQASKMQHNKTAKTIYYDNAVIKVYDIPIFYLPKLSHPDPSVKRRSGLLPPALTNSKNLGTGFKVPYFWAINHDRDLTITGNLFDSERPLLLGEYRQAFQKSNLIMDLGYTEGFKKKEKSKKMGDRSHLFAKFVKNFETKNNSENNFELSLQNVSDDKYLKLYKIKSNLASYETDTLESSINYTHQNDDLFIGFNASMYETLKEDYNDKYEYVLPDVTLNKSLFNNQYGNIDLTSNLKVHNYDTNKFTKFLINDIDWKYKNINFDSGISGRILGKIKNVNYEAKNTEFKKDPTSEVYGALGYLTEVDLFKKTENKFSHLLSPKMLVRFAPNHMRKEPNGPRLNHLNVFSLDRLGSSNNFESGLSTTVGFDYEIKDDNSDKQFNLKVGQIINSKENKNMPDSSSLNEKLSDVVGKMDFQINNKVNLNYNFAIDQNYNDLNYNEITSELDLNPVKFNVSYLQEKEHIGNKEYMKAKINLAKGTNGMFSAETKRNLVTDSAEYYNLSYEYLNDCLRAGLVYRREFYEDSELEAENSLMFKITFIPFGDINSPSFSQ